MRAGPGTHGVSLSARDEPPIRGEVHTAGVEQMSGTTTWVHTAGGWQPHAPDHRGHGQVLWVRVAEPDQLADVAAGLGLDADVVRAAGTRGTASGRRATGAGSGHGRPHVEHLAGGGVYLSAPTVAFDETTADVLTGTVTCLVLDAVVLTAETGRAGVLAGVAERLIEPGASADRRSAGVLRALLSCLVASAADVEIALADQVQVLEEAVFSAERGAPVEQIYALKREVAEARRALVPLEVELPELASDSDDRGATDAWVRRRSTAVDRLDRRLAAHDGLLGDMLSAHLALVSVRQNDDVRRISAWAAIAAAPTLLASIYGMNFEHMPELVWPVGYPLALGVMLGLCLGLYRLFVRSGWL